MSINLKDVTMPRCHSEWPARVVRAARIELRRRLAEGDDMSKNINTDALLEQVWNAAVRASGHDGKVEQQNQLSRK